MDRDQQRMDAAARLVLERMPLMTDAKRLAALEAVAEAAREIREQRDSGEFHAVASFEAWQNLRAALDAHRARKPERAETVTLAVWRHKDGGTQWVDPASEANHFCAELGWTRLGTVTLPLTVEPTP